MCFCTQVRVYAVGDLGDDLFADEAPQQPVAVHRLPQKMSSIAWCPDDEVGRLASWPQAVCVKSCKCRMCMCVV